ncbi:hypothetical protein [Corynebacterium sp. A21]|uniref:hypothetical protein n=1 Tax=Corynebacterium sp. A21 TaxID=3457318 RepID=UPI003FD00245
MKKFLALTALAGASAVALSACATEPDTFEAGSPVAEGSLESTTPAPVATAPAVASEVILAEADSPTGYLYSDVAEVLASGAEDDADVIAVLTETSSGTTTEPAQCGALLPTAVDILVQLDQEPNATASSEFAAADGTVISVFATTSATTPRVPGDLGECANFVRSSAYEGSELLLPYETQPLDLKVEGIEEVTAARVQSAENPSEPANTVLAGEVDGVYFYLTAPATVDDQLIVDLAGAQVDKITHR